MSRFWVFVIGLAAWVSLARSARADDSPDVEKARALFREGRSLASSGKFDEACPKFEESLKLDAGIGTMFNLADCLEHTGRLKKAQETFIRVADAAHEKAQPEREQVARERARAIDDKLPKLGIDVKELVDGLEVLIDGTVVDRTKWAAGQRVEPGPHEVTAKAPNKKPWTLRVETGAAATMFTITVPKLEDAPAKAAAAAAKEPEEKKPLPEKEPVASNTKPSNGNQTVKLFFLGGATAGLVLAGTGFIIYKIANDNAKDICPSGVACSDEDIRRHEDYIDEASKARAVGYLGLGLTGAALVGFTTITLASSSSGDNSRSASLSATPLVGPGSWGASVRGRF